MKLKPVSLKSHPNYNEKWLQDQIAEDPSILGLGNLSLRAKEKIQSSGGRLDLLLEDPDADTPKRYECELQLGATDESHIIRTIEYWDLERKRYPQYDHTAVLVAEDVTSRFLNVVHLFNGHIPLIVLKMTAYEVNGEIALTFTKILDEVQLGIPDEDENVEPTNRNYWEKRANTSMLSLTDKLFDSVKEVEPLAEMNYNKYYIGIMRNKVAANFCWFKPRKAFVSMIFKQIPEDSFIQQLEETGLDVTKKTKWNEYYIKFTQAPTPEQKELLKTAITLSRSSYGI
jgi:hypothetical protein